MPVFRVFYSQSIDSFGQRGDGLAVCLDDGRICVDLCSDWSDPVNTATRRAVIELDDVPELIRELRRVAKLAKEGGGNG